MATVHANMGMSLGGFGARPNAGPDNALDDGGMRIHRWVYDLEAWRERQSLAGGRTNHPRELERIGVAQSEKATDLRFRVVK